MNTDEILIWMEASSLGQWMNETRAAFAGTESVHVMALALLFGTILIVDLRLLGIFSTSRRFSTVARETLKYTWVGFVFAVITGVMMFFANPVFYFNSTEFWIKMGFLFLAGLNMAFFEFRTIKSVTHWDNSPTPPIEARAAGALSILFWSGVIIFGRLIGYAQDDPFDDFFADFAALPYVFDVVNLI